MKSFFYTALYFCFLATALSQTRIIEPSFEARTSFAIVIDSETLKEAEKAVYAYRDAVEGEELPVYILVNQWESADEIRNELKRLFGSKSLEGAVLIGDIPIPMIRGAQHMTSAFKLDESRYEWFRSSVPSDRFYEDFDLKFEYLKQDTTNTLCYHYRLLPDSPQRIEKEIYTGRIKPSPDDETKYEKIRQYLEKVVRVKKEKNKLDNMMVFTGHGYHSESLTSWTDEHQLLRDQFPRLFLPGGNLTYLNFDMSRDMKNILIRELQKDALDVTVFHAHGDDNVQYILDYPAATMISQNVESIRMFLRSKLRSAERRGRDLEKTKSYYIENYGVPDEWFEGAFDDSVKSADSLFSYNLDIHSDDIEKFDPRTEIFIFDECFNGSFHEDRYIAGEYLFGDGSTVAGIANSVNCLQDKWANHLIETFGYGARIGLWHRTDGYLENHILGDPTYRFDYTDEFDINVFLNRVDDLEEEDIKDYLNSPDSFKRGLGVYAIYRKGSINFENDLFNRYFKEPSFNVRLHIFAALAKFNGDLFRKFLIDSIKDPFEFIRRKSAVFMGKIGDDKYIPYLIETFINDPSRRVSFTSRGALGVYNYEKLISAVNAYIDEMPSYPSAEEMKKSMLRTAERNKTWLFEELLPNISDDSLKLSKRRSAVRTFRNYNFVEGVEPLLVYLKDKKIPLEVRLAIAEALGWYNYSIKKDLIIKACGEVAESDSPAELIEEVIKTKNRLSTGANVVITP